MNRRLILFIALISILGNSWHLLADKRTKQMEKWVAIITERDFALKYEKLEQFRAEYGNEKNSNLVPNMYMHLNEAAYQIKKYDKAIEYGEKALTFPDIEKDQQLLILFRIANSYFIISIQNGTDAALKADYLNKAMKSAQEVIDKANALKASQPGKESQFNTEVIAPSLRLQSKIINNLRPNDPQALLDASQKALAAMSLDKSKESDQLVRTLANMIKKAGRDAEFLSLLEELYKIKPEADLARSIGYVYSQPPLSNDAKALEYFLVAYQMKKTTEVAYFIGILYNKAYEGANREKEEDLDNAINFMAEAYVQAAAQNDVKLMPKTDEILKHLVYNIKLKEKPLEEQDKYFLDIVTAAKGRLGISSEMASTPLK